MARFLAKCLFEPHTGCVVWIGGKSWGRGKNIRYGTFSYEGKPWLAHRWAAKHIHGFDIDGLQVDHCCPNIPIPNTLCVAHLRPETGERNRHLQTERRRHFVHLQVGLLDFFEVYAAAPAPDPEAIPFYDPPSWLTIKGPIDGSSCPF